MMQFSWAYRGENEGVGHFLRETNLTRQRFMDRSNLTRTILHEVMSTADSAVFACDAKSHTEGLTFVHNTVVRGTILRDDAPRGTYGFKEKPEMVCLKKRYGCRKLDLPAVLCLYVCMEFSEQYF